VKTLFILRGLPGSGKSTLAKTLEQMHMKALSVSLDDFIALHGSFDKSRMKAWAHFNKERIEHAMKKAVPVIIYHNVNAQGWQWRPYQDLAKEYGYQCFVLIVENCHGGKTNKEIPEKQLESLKEKFKVHL
jgi:predicted kinase